MRSLVGLLVVALLAATLTTLGAEAAADTHVASTADAVDIDLSADESGLYVTFADGVVTVSGSAVHFGDQPPLADGERVSALAVSPDGAGYWLFTNRGNAFGFGSAQLFGDAGHLDLAGEIIAAVPTPDGLGYYMLGSDGGIFTFGNAEFLGSIPQVLPGVQLDAPVVGMSATPGGYLLVAADGGTFAFGNAEFHGSIPGILPGVQLASPIVGLVPGPAGYLMLGGDGGVFNFGVSNFHGSLSGVATENVVSVAVKSDLSGYLILDRSATVWPLGDTTTIGGTTISESGDADIVLPVAPPVLVTVTTSERADVTVHDDGGAQLATAFSTTTGATGTVNVQDATAHEVRIDTDGDWTIRIQPVSYARQWRAGAAALDGTGTTVVRAVVDRQRHDVIVTSSAPIDIVARPLGGGAPATVLSTTSAVTNQATAELAADGPQLLEIRTTGTWTLSTTASRNGGSVTFGTEAAPVGLRPWEDSCGTSCRVISPALFDTLMELDADGNVVPGAAASLTPNPDFARWTLVLRPDLRFSDGSPVTSQTIVDMFARQQLGSQAAGALASAGLVEVTLLDPLTVEYVLGTANSAFPHHLARPVLGSIFTTPNPGDPTATLGTGPFSLTSYGDGVDIRLARNPLHWRFDEFGRQLPYLDEVRFIAEPDESRRVARLASGEFDALHTFQQTTAADVATLGGVAVKSELGNNVGGGMFNVLSPPLDDLRVRRGLLNLMNQDDLIAVDGVSGPAGTQWFSPDSVWHSDAAAASYTPHDPSAGTQSISAYINDPTRSDGRPVGAAIQVTLACPGDPVLDSMMAAIEAAWSGSGLVQVTRRSPNQATHINDALGTPEDNFAGSHQAHCWRFGSNDDPSITLNSAAGPATPDQAEASGAPFSAVNFSNYFDAESYGWLIEAIETDDLDERKSLYGHYMTRINDQAVYWYQAHTSVTTARDEDLLGFVDAPTSSGGVAPDAGFEPPRWEHIHRGV